MEYRVYIVEDDDGISSAISKQCEKWDITTQTVNDFHNVLNEIIEYNPHLILMDISLPFYNGFYWTTELRKLNNTPIIFISSANDNTNAIMAMNMGADDFIAKPFDIDILIAKMQALLRRSYDFSAASTILQHKQAFLQTSENCLVYNDKHIELTKNESRILYTLMSGKGSIVSREKLMDALWQTESFIDDNTLTVNVNRLRKKLESYGLTDFIVTKFGEGYTLG